MVGLSPKLWEREIHARGEIDSDTFTRAYKIYVSTGKWEAPKRFLLPGPTRNISVKT